MWKPKQQQAAVLCDSAAAQSFIKSGRVHFSAQPSHSSITDTSRGSSNSRVTNSGSERHQCVGLDQINGKNKCQRICFTAHISSGCGNRGQQRVQGVTHFQHMISHDAFGLDEDLVDHRVTMVTVHFVDAVLVKLGQREQHLQGQSLGLLTVTQLHRLDGADTEMRDRGQRSWTKCMNVNSYALLPFQYIISHWSCFLTKAQMSLISISIGNTDHPKRNQCNQFSYLFKIGWVTYLITEFKHKWLNSFKKQLCHLDLKCIFLLVTFRNIQCID